MTNTKHLPGLDLLRTAAILLVLTYHSTDNSPAYFRVATLTDFDGSKWQLGQAHPVLVPAGPSTSTPKP